MTETVRGTHVTVSFDGSRCIHARMCVLGNPAVFVPNVAGDWIRPDAAEPEAVIRLGLNCPSGAIRVAWNDGREPTAAAPAVNTLRIRENGPLALEAPHSIGDADQPVPRAVLCRCGASTRKPFCDGSHTAAGFAATGEPPAQDSQPLAARDGPVTVTPLTDGPLRVQGNLEIVSGTGRTVNRVRSAFLCRCGHSASKPYCDGSHKAAGFRAP